MRKYKTFLLAILAIGFAMAPCIARSEVVVYKLTMALYVPRVYDNTRSLGYRKNQLQKITGYVTVDKDIGSEDTEPFIRTWHLVNKTHKVQKQNVTYHDAYADNVMWRYIGSNKTGVFKNTQVKFSLDLDPSYNIGADEPDNALIIQLAGRGSTEKTIRGSVTGQIGCGCTAYGHISPTRTLKCDVSDITPLYGTFTMKRVGTMVCK